MPLLCGLIGNKQNDEMKTRAEYGCYENFKRENERELLSEYKANHENFKDQYDYPSFEDFCIGKWQWLR